MTRRWYSPSLDTKHYMDQCFIQEPTLKCFCGAKFPNVHRLVQHAIAGPLVRIGPWFTPWYTAGDYVYVGPIIVNRPRYHYQLKGITS